jgi:hypothetical protein
MKTLTDRHIDIKNLNEVSIWCFKIAEQIITMLKKGCVPHEKRTV